MKSYMLVLHWDRMKCPESERSPDEIMHVRIAEMKRPESEGYSGEMMHVGITSGQMKCPECEGCPENKCWYYIRRE